MKTINQLGSSLLIFLILGSAAMAQQVGTAPPPKGLNLKTDPANDFELDPHQAEDMKTGMNTLSVTLDTALNSLTRWNTLQAEKELTRTFSTLLSQAESQRRDTLFYTALKHGDLIGQVLAQTEEPGAVGIIDAKVENLWQTLAFAKKYSKFDLDRAEQALDGKKDETFNLHYASFGYDYNRFATELVDSVVNARAQFILTYMAVGWLGKAIEHDKTEAGPLAVATYQLAKAQKYLRTFYQRGTQHPEGIPSHHYIAATKELRWRIQEALKEFEKRPEIRTLLQASQKEEGAATVQVVEALRVPDNAEWSGETKKSWDYAVKESRRQLEVEQYYYQTPSYRIFSSFCDRITEKGSPAGQCLSSKIVDQVRLELLKLLSNDTNEPSVYEMYKARLDNFLHAAKTDDATEWGKYAEMRRIRSELATKGK